MTEPTDDRPGAPMGSGGVGVGQLDHDTVREALRLLGQAGGGSRAVTTRTLREHLLAHGTVRSLLDRAPQAARTAYVRLAQDGPASVSDLLGRGWWGHGTLPPPLDWLQRRALIVVGVDGLVHPTEEARLGFADQRLFALLDPGRADAATPARTMGEGARVEAAGCVLVAADAGVVDRALAVSDAGLRSVAPTVALSAKSAPVVIAALRAAGVALADDTAVTADPQAPALPGTSEDALGPRAVRELLARAVADGRQVRLRYYPSSRGGAATERVVDPWAFAEDLLRGYCHLRAGERTFAVDRVGSARLLPSALQVPPPA